MKPKDIVIATAMILIAASFLSGCSLLSGEQAESRPSAEMTQAQKKPSIPKRTAELLKTVQAVQKEVKLKLSVAREVAEAKVKIELENPEKKPVTSTQLWLSFDTKRLQGKTINTDGSAFELPAPLANEFDNENGLVMLGRSNPDPLTDELIYVAEITFDISGEGATALDVYDYRDDLSGHTSVNTVIDNNPYNLLIKPETPALIIE